MTWKNWVRSGAPAAPIFWIAYYEVAVDAVIGLPVFEHSRTAKRALEKGVIQKITEERAQELNERFAAGGQAAVLFLEEQLETRWRTIREQFNDCIANG